MIHTIWTSCQLPGAFKQAAGVIAILIAFEKTDFTFTNALLFQINVPEIGSLMFTYAINHILNMKYGSLTGRRPDFDLKTRLL